MSIRKGLIIIILAFLIQPIISSMLPAWLVPDLDFCILLVFALALDGEKIVVPTILASVLALMGDIYHSQFIGVTVIAMVTTLLLIMIIKRLGNKESALFLGILIIPANLIYCLIYWMFYAALSSPYSFMYMLSHLPGMVIPNIVTCFIIWFFTERRMAQQKRDKYFG